MRDAKMVISQLQKENCRVRSEKNLLLEEVSKAIEDDEQSIATDENSASC